MKKLDLELIIVIITIPSNTTKIKYNNNGTAVITTIDGTQYNCYSTSIFVTNDKKIIAEVKK